MPFQFFQSAIEHDKPLKIEALGLDLAVRLPSSVSGGELTLLETVNAPGFGPPLHRHRETEIFRVLEGRYLFQVDDRRFEAGEGDVVCVPGGASHAFVNIAHKPARQLVVMLPGMDAYAFFLGLSEVFLKKPSRDDLNAFGAPWGVVFLGPPLSVSRP
ncbi:MAG TPA: cupin domain-containing protein [Candidatus Acidoferrum sp.]|jgi:quercetin dioxygenase-like cupin family protein